MRTLADIHLPGHHQFPKTEFFFQNLVKKNLCGKGHWVSTFVSWTDLIIAFLLFPKLADGLPVILLQVQKRLELPVEKLYHTNSLDMQYTAKYNVHDLHHLMTQGCREDVYKFFYFYFFISSQNPMFDHLL